MYRRLFIRFVVFLANCGVAFPSPIMRKIERQRTAISSKKQLERIFANTTLNYDEAGYWSVCPMPSLDDLNSFYNLSYWPNRDDRPNWLNHRDLSHFKQLQPLLSDFLQREEKPIAVNFGSGHGGISFLLVAMGFQVINVDPFENEIFDFTHVKNISEIKKQCSLIYGSHSFEHVRDPKAEFRNVVDQLEPNGILFVEVPNPNYENYSTLDATSMRVPDLQPPHTIYFTQRFFTNLQLQEISNDTYLYEGNSWGSRATTREGEVIRYIGRKN